MTIELPQDGAGPAPIDPSLTPDPHGQAALLLVESLIHGLIGREALTNDEAIQIIEVAAEVKEALAEDMGEHPAIMAASLTLLHAMASSLRRDVGT
jgi:hypothetical protein